MLRPQLNFVLRHCCQSTLSASAMASSQCVAQPLSFFSSWVSGRAGGAGAPLEESGGQGRKQWQPQRRPAEEKQGGAPGGLGRHWRRPEGPSDRKGFCCACQFREAQSRGVSLERLPRPDVVIPQVEGSSEAPQHGKSGGPGVELSWVVLGAGLLLMHADTAWADTGGGGDPGWAAALGDALYDLGQTANSLVQGQIQGGLTLTSGAVILGAGLVTSLSPCTLSVLPLTIGYIGGYDQGRSRAALVRDAAAFSLGLATTLAALGTGASLAGKAYGQIGAGLPIGASLVAMLMGLNLLEILPLRFPSFLGNVDARELAAGLPNSVQAYLAGLVFALAASPCSTPVLATLLTYVASTQDPLVGSALLFTYTVGYVTPLLLAASFTGALKQLLSLRKFSAWINPASGCLLLSGGLYTFLLRVAPAP